MKIALAADHAGFELKQRVKALWLELTHTQPELESPPVSVDARRFGNFAGERTVKMTRE